MAASGKPTFSDILGVTLATKSVRPRERVHYSGDDASLATMKRDPCYVDYSSNIIGIHGDGNCMFRAIAYAIGDDDLDHVKLREKVCDHVAADPVMMDFPGMDAHVEQMRVLGCYGEQAELIAAARIVGRCIFVWEDGRLYTKIGDPEHPAIHLRYENRIHYNLHIVDPTSAARDPQISPLRQAPPAQTGEGDGADEGWITVGRGGRPTKRPRVTSPGRSPGLGAGEATSEKQATRATVHSQGRAPAAEAELSNAAAAGTTKKRRGGRPPKRSFFQIPKARVGNDSEAATAPVQKCSTGVADNAAQPAAEPPQSASVPTVESSTAGDAAAIGAKRRVGRPKKKARFVPQLAEVRKDARAVEIAEGARDGGVSVGDSPVCPEGDCAAHAQATSAVRPEFRPPAAESAVTEDGGQRTASQGHLAESGRVSGEGVKTLTRSDLDALVADSQHSIVIERVQTDLSFASEGDLEGPWQYRDSTKVAITYLAGEHGDKRCIALCNLKRRGFCGPSSQAQLRYKFYSWLRFKDAVKESGNAMASVLSDESLFHAMLGQVNRYYAMHHRCVEQEGLEPHKGPQVFEDRHNLIQLHYYGRGWYKYFRLTTFREVVVSRYGDEQWLDLQVDPWLETVTEVDFEMMLREVHAKLRDRHFRHTKRLEPYAGPQCHEDRGSVARMEYNVLFVRRPSTADRRRERHNRRPVAQPPPQRIAAPASDDSGGLDAFFLRKCVECNQLRVLDSDAAAKYPLGHYTYAGSQQRVSFTCDMLVGISCDTPPDFVTCTGEDKPPTWVALGPHTTEDRLPPPAIQLRSLRVLDASDRTEETRVVGAYHHRNDRRAAGWTGRRALMTRTSNSGVVTLGTVSARRRFKAIRGCRFTAGRFTVDSPREAKCCQPWHDPTGTDAEDPLAELGIRSLRTVRDIHAVHDSLRRVRCIICNQQTPGLPYPDWQVQVPERGRMTDLSPDSVVADALKTSALLHPRSKCTVVLDPRFRGAKDTVLTDRNVTGVCTTCSPAYILDAENNIISRPLTSNIDSLVPDPDDVDDFADAVPRAPSEPAGRDVAGDDGNAEDEPCPTHISLYSSLNLMSTDVYSDEEYFQFVNTWTRAETMVLRPVHVFITVMRLRANKVPFSKHGTICYRLKKDNWARNLPWYDFGTLPFIVIKQNRTDGTSAECMVNMETIVRARYLMERPMPCKYNPGVTRPFYRFVGEQWMPFSDDNMRQLQARLTETHRPCEPNGLRVLIANDVCARADKVLRFNEFCNWLESGFKMADTLRDSFVASCGAEVADATESKEDYLWRLIEEYVVGRAIDDATERHQELNGRPDADGEDDSDAGEIDVTMRHVVDFAIARGWILSTTTGGGDAGPSDASALLLCCEELEILGREFGNDEGAATGVAAGATACVQTERPDVIREQGIARSALHHVPMPAADRENPIPESEPGYMQMMFPEIFRSGDADPYQDRKVSIRQPRTTWRQGYLHWAARQPEGEGNVEFQFVVGNQLSRDICGQEARLAVSLVDFPDGLPTKDELMNDPALCKRLAQSLLFLQAKLEDSDAFWRARKHEMFAAIRDLEDPPPWRPDDIPHEVVLWQTRAVPYNHHPAIHRLCDNAAISEALDDERYLNARLSDALKHPGIVSWVSAFIGEMDTLALARERYDTIYFMVRSEWGANANPHVHRHVMSESFSRFLHELRKSLDRSVADIDRDLRADDPTLERDVSRSAVDTQVDAAWRDCQQQYVERVRRCYTNWNAGFTKTGERTYDFGYDRKTVVCRARMAAMIDTALTTGNFVALDQLYVSVINGTLRHTGHSGHGDMPSGNDGCAVRRLVVDKAATEAARSEKPRARAVKKPLMVCKRRMPRLLRTTAAVVPDAHDRRIKQCETACNDKWMGGHDPFAVLHILNNVDDKAVVPVFLTRPPRVEWKQSPEDGSYRFEVKLAEAKGDGSVGYALKYGFKPVAPVRTPSDVLQAALEHREGGDNVGHGTVKRMYNQVAASVCQSIYQTVHKNWQLPLLLKNVDVRGIHLGGTRMLKPSTADADPSYVFASALERFDARLAENIRHGNIPLDDFQRVMSVREFFDTFTVTEKTIEGDRVFQIGRRHASVRGKRVCIRLLPHHGKSNANPARPQFWKYARDIVLWCEPCYLSLELMPHPNCVTDDAIAVHWKSRFEALVASGKHVPRWVLAYHREYDAHAGDDSADETSDESEGDDASDAAADDAHVESDGGEERELNATRVRDRFYQTVFDTMTACRPEDIEDASPRTERAPASITNPAGYDFQAQWLGDRVVNPDHVRTNYARLVTLGAGDAAHAAPITPGGRQLVLPRIVCRYMEAQREWARSRREWNAYDRAMDKWRNSRSTRGAEPVPPTVADIRQTPPKALRAFLLGDPGAGKSTTLRSTVHELTVLLEGDEADWTQVVKLSAPTGCASFHMAHGAMTIHRLYAIRVGQAGDEPLEQNSDRLKNLCQALGSELGLIIFDEFSMIQRQMIRWITVRLAQAGINLEHIGVLFVGDPAQILPIGDCPVWSLRREKDDGKECSEASLLGMMAFRELFRMPALDTIEGYETWRRTVGKQQHELYDDERREVARFRAMAFEGDYETVYLNEVRRTVENDQLADHFTKVVIPSFRYGKVSRANLQWLRENTATAEQLVADPMWTAAVTLHGHHWFSELAENRATVESDNARALVRFATGRNAPVMAIDAQHIPAKKAARLQKISAKEFRGVPSVFFACSGLPLLLLENVAPSVGLFNGAHVEFVGPLYLNDDWQVALTRAEYDARVAVSGVTLTSPLDTPASSRDRMYQVPAGSVIIQVNGDAVGGDERRLAELVGASPTVELVFRTPKLPPHLPEFVVVRVPSYTDSGGPNVLGIEDADDLVPIRMVKRGRDKDKGKTKRSAANNDDRHTEFRVGPPLEGGSAFTGFKGQGATLPRVVAKVRAWVETPGFWTVVVSRVKHPHHLHIPDDQWPTLEELEVQRLNENVLEAEIFERQMKINAAKTWRHYQASEVDGEWSPAENTIGDAVSAAWRRRLERDVAATVCDDLNRRQVDVSLADVQRIVDRMADTDEGLILAAPIYISRVQCCRLLRNRVQRGRRRSAGPNAPKRPASTSAGGRRGAKSRRASHR